MSVQTPLHEVHLARGGRMIDFGGWLLPRHYGSAIEEHQAVRQNSGMFDISHLATLDINGAGAGEFLRHLLSNDVAKLADGDGLYSCMCNEAGGVIDDMMVFRISDSHYRLTTNSANREKNIAWIEGRLAGDVALNVISGIAIISVQGPQSIPMAASVLNAVLGGNIDLADMPRYAIQEMGDWYVTRSGYTGEDGVEITMPENAAFDCWERLGQAGVRPVGMQARDTLRLEAGMCQYGKELDETHTPVAAGLAAVVDISDDAREFTGKELLEDHKEFGAGWHKVGLVLDGKGELRSHVRVQLAGKEMGRVTSAAYSPTLKQFIGLALVTKDFKGNCDVLIDDLPIAAHVVPLPFVKHGMTSF